MTAPATTGGLHLHLPTGLSRWVRPLLWTALAVVVLAVLAAYVFPTRTWIDQRRSLDETAAALDELRAERGALEARLGELDSDDEIEELARSQFGLVLPGEEAYAVLPAPEPPVDLPTMWPYGNVDSAEATATAVPGDPVLTK